MITITHYVFANVMAVVFVVAVHDFKARSDDTRECNEHTKSKPNVNAVDEFFEKKY